MADDKNKKIIEGFDEALSSLQDKLGNIASLLGADMRKKLSDLTTDAGDFVDKFAKGQNITKGLGEKLKSVQKDINKLSLDRLKLENDLAKAEQNRNSKQANKIRDQLLSNKLATQQLDDTTTTLSKLKQTAEEEEKITAEKEKQEGLAGSLKKAFEENFKITVKQVKEMFTLTGMIDMMVKGLITANNNSVWISKNLGYSAAGADLLTDKMQLMSLASNDTNMTLKNSAEAMAQLATATGGVFEPTEDILNTQIMLTKQLGLSGEEAAGIYKFSVLTGKSSEKVNDEMLAAFANTRNLVKGSANFKETMAAASKVSGQLAINFKNNAASITSAVVQAQALGTTLEQTKTQGRQLLDFESSIENELKAELLTGQSMNLERARAAALQGDQVTVMKELNNQGMTLEKFSSMNVLAQESFAKAIGLSADELSNQLNKQKMATEQGKSLAELNAEDLKAAEKRKTIQDKFNNMMEKLMDIVGSIGTLFSPLIEAITWIADHSIVVYGLLAGWLFLGKGIASTFKGIVGSVKSIGSGIKDKVMGGGKAAVTPAAPAAVTPAAPAAGKGGGMLSSLKGISTTDMIKGAAAILILSAALFVAAKAFQEFATVKWPDVVLGGIALVGLAIIAKSLGNSAPAIIEGAIAIGILGIALIPLAYALNLAAPAIEAFGNVILKVFTGIGIVIKSAAEGISTIFTSLTNVDVSKLLAIGPALIMVGLGLASLGAGGVIGAIGSFLGGDPIAKIERLAAAGSGLQAAATGLQGVAIALTQVATALAAIDISKLNALDNFASNRSTESVVGGITSFLTAPIKAIGSMAEGAGGGTDNTEMVKAINEVRDAVNKLYAKDTSIHMDGKKVGTTLSQNSHKVA